MRGAPPISAAVGTAWWEAVAAALFFLFHMKNAIAPISAIITMAAIMMPTSAPVPSPDFFSVVEVEL
jgi:hypothetical protein